MINPLYARERVDLLKRIRPGTAHAADFRKAVETCFDYANEVAQRRHALSLDPNLTAAHRKEELARLVKDRLFPTLAGHVQPARKAKAVVQEERSKLRLGNGLDKGTAALMNDAAAVDAALYFAQREMAPAGGLSTVDFEMLTQPAGPW